MRGIAYIFGVGAIALLIGCAGSGGAGSTHSGLHVRIVNQAANDLVLNPANGALLVSVPGSAGANGNSLVPIYPATGAVGTSVFVGSEPDQLALSDDGTTLYIGLDGAAAIRKFDVGTMTASGQYSLGSSQFEGAYYPEDIAVLPGSPNSVAVSLMSPEFSPPNEGVAIFDDGVQRPNAILSLGAGLDSITFGDATHLYGFDSGSSGFEFSRLAVDANGVTQIDTAGNIISGFGAKIRSSNGQVYSSNGQVIDPTNDTLIGTYGGASGASAFAISPARNRIYFVVGNVLKTFDLSHFTLVASQSLPGVSNQVSVRSMVTWGATGLALAVQVPGGGSSTGLTSSTTGLTTGTGTTGSGGGSPTSLVVLVDNAS